MQLLPHGAQDLPTAGRRVSRLTSHRFKMGGAWPKGRGKAGVRNMEMGGLQRRTGLVA
jgi:hypothetical protein